MRQFVIFEKFNLFRRLTNTFDPTKFALFAGGNTGASDVTTTTRYFYSNDSINSGQSLSNRRSEYAAAGNSTRAILAAGKVNDFLSPTSVKYTYATNVFANGGSLQTARKLLAATGNSTRGIFQQGVVTTNPGTTANDKYTYSNDTRAAAVSLGSPARHAFAAAGDASFGIFCGG
jgi:hypothetical protein